ncbi:hypothetical protein Pst134EA_032914 [Puccinia striiformis f. sp. tritici]|uniref:uncharacterized protein n=1 Tax=Puccinia striiformis f. sp. tritici TaxID=168172 RepID=UPI0020075ECA|nr:uncharacterized protein Pst134EA_032914 [Puccinia striiformis f. sp. tritici]KAH9441522.1 hypothetical protein Pst134EA_032914 [Puccinia striiformis f. sp. tritici]
MASKLPNNVATVGVGLVGEQVVHQLMSARLRSEFPGFVRFIHRVDISKIESLHTGGVEEVVSYLADTTKLPRPLLVVDCISSQPFADAYPRILASDRTHLKSRLIRRYFPVQMRSTQRSRRVSGGNGNLVFKEATVGAGLPIISTLRELVMTGDELTKIEGILARNISSPIGLPLGFQSVPTRTLIPEPLVEVTDPVEFMSALHHLDAQYGRFRDEAFTKGEVMRYVGIIDLTDPDKPLIKAGLERYPFSHPFATMKGSDNIISFHSKRYSRQSIDCSRLGSRS